MNEILTIAGLCAFSVAGVAVLYAVSLHLYRRERLHRARLDTAWKRQKAKDRTRLE